MASRTQFCTFYLDGLLFGLEVQKVQEVIRHQPITLVPLASAVVHGLINLRGQIVTALDMRERLELAVRPEAMVPMNVVVRTADGLLSLLVDAIGEVVEVEEDAFERPPEMIRGVTRELIRGVYKLSERLLIVLDLESLVNLAATRT